MIRQVTGRPFGSPETQTFTCIPVSSNLPPEYQADGVKGFRYALERAVRVIVKDLTTNTDRGDKTWLEAVLLNDDVQFDVTDCNHIPAAVYWRQNDVFLVAWLQSVKTVRVANKLHRLADYFVSVDESEGGFARIDYSEK